MSIHTHAGATSGFNFNDFSLGDAVSGNSRFAGMPSGIQLFSDWYFHRIDFASSLNIPQDGVNWTIAPTGAGTLALGDDTFPPHLVITTGATDDNSMELQYTAPDGPGEWISFANGRRHYFETMLRFRDAGNVDAAVEEVEWFVGWAVTDTTVIDGTTDFIGFRKRDLDDDSTQSIDFVSGRAASTALVDKHKTATGWTTLNPSETQATDRTNKVLGANQWIKLGFLIVPNSDGSAARALTYVNNKPTNKVSLVASDGTIHVPDTDLCLTIALQTGEGVAKNMDVAYVLQAAEIGAMSGAGI
jgi:hypothetical protein